MQTIKKFKLVEQAGEGVPLMYIDQPSNVKTYNKAYLKALAYELESYAFKLVEHDPNATTTVMTMSSKGLYNKYVVKNNTYRRLYRAGKKGGVKGIKQAVYLMMLKYATYKDVVTRDGDTKVIEHKRSIPKPVKDYFDTIINLIDLGLLPCRNPNMVK